MRILINDIPVALGEPLPEQASAELGLRRPSLWRRLRRRGGNLGRRLEAENCVVFAFDGRFHLYPCLHGYLNRDRQWRTAVSIVVDGGMVRAVLMQVINGRYAASEFADRFRDLCAEHAGEGQVVDRYTRRWRNGATAFLSQLQPDGRNASFSVELLDA